MEDFIFWATTRHMDVTPAADGQFLQHSTQCAWEAWQDRPKPVANDLRNDPQVKALRDLCAQRGEIISNQRKLVAGLVRQLSRFVPRETITVDIAEINGAEAALFGGPPPYRKMPDIQPGTWAQPATPTIDLTNEFKHFRKGAK